MKSSAILGIAILIIIILASVLVSAALSQPIHPTTGSNVLAMQSKIALPEAAKDRSEVGSTSGIVIMGIAIALIVTLPILFRKKRR